MNEDLKEKLKQWFEPHPQKCLPAQAAAATLSLREKLDKQDWQDADTKKLIIQKLDFLLDYLFFQDMFRNPLKPEQNLQLMFEMSMAIENKTTSNFQSKIKKTFISKAKRIQRFNNIDSYGKFRSMVLGCTTSCKNIAIQQASANIICELFEVLSDENHELYKQRYNESFIHEHGPKNIEEMMACIKAISFPLNTAKLITEKNFLYKSAECLDEAVLILNEAQNDLGDNVLTEQSERIDTDVKSVLKTHYINADQLGALAEIFISNNQNKLSPNTHSRFLNALEEFFIYTHLHALSQSQLGAPLEIDDEFIQNIRDFRSQFLPQYPKVDPNDIYAEVVDALKNTTHNKKRALESLQRIEKIHNNIPSNMEELPVFHYVEKEEVRKIRKRLFGYDKREFVKEMASTEEGLAELAPLNLSEEHLKTMREKGILPEETGLTIEHIIDREHGGTNHKYNLIIMSSKQNKINNNYKKLFLSAHKNADQGVWINMLIPKKREDGTRPRVHIDINDNYNPTSPELIREPA